MIWAYSLLVCYLVSLNRQYNCLSFIECISSERLKDTFILINRLSLGNVCLDASFRTQEWLFHISRQSSNPCKLTIVNNRFWRKHLFNVLISKEQLYSKRNFRQESVKTYLIQKIFIMSLCIHIIKTIFYTKLAWLIFESLLVLPPVIATFRESVYLCLTRAY